MNNTKLKLTSFEACELHSRGFLKDSMSFVLLKTDGTELNIDSLIELEKIASEDIKNRIQLLINQIS